MPKRNSRRRAGQDFISSSVKYRGLSDWSNNSFSIALFLKKGVEYLYGTREKKYPPKGGHGKGVVESPTLVDGTVAEPPNGPALRKGSEWGYIRAQISLPPIYRGLLPITGGGPATPCRRLTFRGVGGPTRGV